MQQFTLRILSTGCALTALGIALGAFGAHGVENKVDPYFFKVFQTASRFHMYQALGLIALGLIHHAKPLGAFRLICSLQIAGIVIFCGTLYALGTSPLFTTANLRWLGAITPIGGVCMITGWSVAAYQLAKLTKTEEK